MLMLEVKFNISCDVPNHVTHDFKVENDNYASYGRYT